MKVTELLVRKAIASLCLLFISLSLHAQTTPTLTSDQPDYPPGATVTLTGTGFLPGEQVRMQVLQQDFVPGDPLTESYQPWYINADGNGNFVTTWIVGQDCIGETLIATADGLTSGTQAQTIFTDANIVIIANTSWSAINTGSGAGGVPTASDAVVVKNGATLTIDVANATCGSLQIGVSGGMNNGDGTVLFSLPTSQLTISDAVLSGALTVGDNPKSGSIDFTGGGKLRIAGAFTISKLGTFTNGTGTVDFIGTSAQTIPVGVTGLVYNNLNINNTSSGGATISAAISNLTGDIRVESGTFDNGGFAIGLLPFKAFAVSNGATFKIGGTSGMVTGIALTKTLGATSLVNYYGANQNVSNESYGHLTTSGSGTKTMVGPAIIAGDLTIGTGTTLDPGASGFNITLAGNWINLGAFTPRTSTVTFTNTNAQAIRGNVTTFGTSGSGGLTITKAGAALTLEQDVTIDGALTLTNGIINGTTNNKTVSITSAGSASTGSNSSHVSGKVARVYSGTGSKNFPVGKGGISRPVIVNYTSLTGTSTVVAEQFETGFPGTPPAGTGQVGTRYWNVTQSNGTGIVYDITLDGTGASFSGAARILKHTSGTTTAITPVAPNYTASGLTSFSDFTLGEVTTISTTTTASNASATYGDASVTLSATVAPNPGAGTVDFYVNNSLVGSGTVNASGVATYNYNPSGLNATTHTIKANYSGYNQYLASSSDPGANGTLTISQRGITVTATAGQTKIYGDADPASFAYTVTSGSLASGDAFDGALTRAPGETVGNYAINQGTLVIKKGAVNVSANYNLTFTSNNFSITQRAITVTATAGQTKLYGDADPASFAYTITSGSLASGDAFDGALTRVAGENVGNYAIQQGTLTIKKGATNVIGNYTFSFVSNDFSITQRPLTVTATAGQTKVYGNADPASFAYTITSGSLASGDAFDGALTRVGGENVGNYAIQQGTLTIKKGATDVMANYDFSFVSNNFSITKRPLQITADAGQNKIYGDADPAFTYSITSGSLAGTDAFDGLLSRIAGENVGLYAITIGTVTIKNGATDVSANYNFTFVSRNFEIKRRPITVTATAGQTKVYGDADPASFAYTITSGTLASGDAFDGALSRVAGENVGTYAIQQGTLTIKKGATNVIGNYTFSFVSNDFSITQRPLTVTATAGQTKVYGNADPASFAYTVTSGSLASGDAFDGALTRVAGENIGNYAIQQGTLTIKKGATNVIGNYTFSFVSNDFSITQRPIIVTATAGQTKVYGNADPASFAYTITSGTLASGDAFDGALSRVAGENVGNYAIQQGTLTIKKGAINVIANYNFSFVSNDFSITQRPITVTATAGQTKVYGNADPASFAYTITSGSLASGDAFDGALSRVAGENVGNYAITQGTLTIKKGAINVIANYNFSFVSNDFSITQRPITVTATAGQTKVYGNADPASFAYTITSGTLASGDAFDGALTRVAGENVGNYAITQGTLTIKKGAVNVIANYNFSFVSNNFSITQRPITINVTAGQTKVYGEADPAAFAYTVGGSGLAASDEFTGALARASGEDVGSYAINQGTLSIRNSSTLLSAISNYNVTFNGASFTITPATLYVKANNKSKAYSDAMPAFTVSYTGFVNGDNELSLGGTLAFTTTAKTWSGPGTYTITPSGLTSSNYNIIFQNGTLTVTRETSTVEYTGAEFASTGCTNCTAANLRLSVTVNDEADGYPGDIRNAKVRFKIVPLNCNSLSEETAVYTSWRTVSLINSGDSTVGTAFLDTAFNIGSCNAKTFQVYVEVNNYYVNADANDMIASVTVTKTLNDYVTGGGHLYFGSGANNKSSGVYKSADNSKVNFGVNVKYNKNGSNLQGNVNVIIRSGGKTYQAKGIVGGSNGSLSIDASNPAAKKAVLTCKANITDAVTGLAVPFGSNASLQLQMTDRGEPGTNDSYSITIWGSNNALLYSSNWTGSASIETPLAGGNLQVNSTSSVNSSPNTGNGLITEAVLEVSPVVNGVFGYRVFPNPSRSVFNVTIETGSSEPAQLTVRDILGRVIEKVSNISSGQTVKLGANYTPGTYFAEVISGKERKTIKLVRQSN